MNKFKIWWNRNIKGKTIVKEDFSKIPFNSFYKVSTNTEVDRYELIDDNLSFVEKYEFPNNICKKNISGYCNS